MPSHWHWWKLPVETLAECFTFSGTCLFHACLLPIIIVDKEMELHVHVHCIIMLSDECFHTKLRVTAERDLFASLLCSICIIITCTCTCTCTSFGDDSLPDSYSPCALQVTVTSDYQYY